MTNEAMRTVSFIHTEITDDLIISFALCTDNPSDVESLILLRTPKYEVFLEEEDRGVKVSLELDQKGFLNEFTFDRNAAAVNLRTSECRFQVDLRSVSTVEIMEMLKVLKRMNFDGRFEVSGLE